MTDTAMGDTGTVESAGAAAQAENNEVVQWEYSRLRTLAGASQPPYNVEYWYGLGRGGRGEYVVYHSGCYSKPYRSHKEGYPKNDICNTFFRTAKEAKAACERHAATGKWE